MKKQFTDEQLDQMMRTLISDAALDERTVDRVADSPTLWWAVQRQINRKKEVAVSPWPPVGKWWRWAIFAVPVGVAAIVLVALFAVQPSDGDQNVAIHVDPVVEKVSPQPRVTAGPNPSVVLPKAETYKSSAVRPLPSSKFLAVKHAANRLAMRVQTASATVAKKSTEIKTDFIALSYAGNPDSGQIVRVKVPSSMMVTLGLVASVERPSNLVDAEVLVGDDGLTRAIRFIR